MSDKRFFIKLWSIHLFIYFLLLTIFLFIRDYGNPDGVFRNSLLLLLLKSPLSGLYGLLDGIGFLIFGSMAVMYLLNLYFQRMYFSYVISLVLTYPIYMYFCNEGYGSYTITILGLLTTIIINGVIFRKNI